MKYLIRARGGKKAAHIWDGQDTACHMATTGGLNPLKYEVFDSTCGFPICQMCQNNSPKPEFGRKEIWAD